MSIDPCGDGGPAIDAQLNTPTGVAVSASGDVFIVDAGNDRVRKLTLQDDDSYVISTVAGTGTTGDSGDDGLATSAELSLDTGLTVSASGDIFIADAVNDRVRKLCVNASNC